MPKYAKFMKYLLTQWGRGKEGINKALADLRDSISLMPYSMFLRLNLGELKPTRLVQKSSSSASYVPPSRNDWDLLFQSMFDELLNPSPSVDNQAAEVIAPIAEVIP
nr:hypothetical protein [Tanacetum cinerariifolium]